VVVILCSGDNEQIRGYILYNTKIISTGENINEEMYKNFL